MTILDRFHDFLDGTVYYFLGRILFSLLCESMVGWAAVGSTPTTKVQHEMTWGRIGVERLETMERRNEDQNMCEHAPTRFALSYCISNI